MLVNAVRYIDGPVRCMDRGEADTITHKRKAAIAVLALLTLAALICGLTLLNKQSARAPSLQPTPITGPTWSAPSAAIPARELAVTTWNVRGYPEKTQDLQDWFSRELAALKPDVLCIQEIASNTKVEEFLRAEPEFPQVAFVDSPDGQDNAVFTTSAVEMRDLPDPEGFQHPAQEAYIACGGFDAVLVTVHLSWTDETRREQEKVLLRSVVSAAEQTDPDVVVVGDFNTEGQDIQALARATGFVALEPQGQQGVGTTHAGHHYDWFLVSPDCASEEAIDCHIERFTGADDATAAKVSDHYPVTARFKTDEEYRDRR